jgi:hypothetical protein
MVLYRMACQKLLCSDFLYLTQPCGETGIGGAPCSEKSKRPRRGEYPIAVIARKASRSDRSVQKIRNEVQGDWLTAGAAGGES